MTAETHTTYYQSLLEHSPVPHFALNRDGTLAYLNRAASNLLRQDPAHSTVRAFAELVPAADLPTFAAFLASSFAGQAPSCQVALLRNGTVVVPVRLQGTFLPDSGQCLLVATDLSAGDGLGPSGKDHAIFRVINEQTTLKICMKDREGRVIFLNQAMARFLGRSPEEVLGKCDLDLVSDPDQAAQIRDNDRHIMETGVTECFEESGTSPAGPWTYLFTKSPYLGSDGETAGVIGLGLDITARKDQETRLNREVAERRNAEEALLRSEQRYRGMVEHQSMYVDRYLPGGFLTYVNPALARALGVKPERLLGTSFYPFVHPEDLDSVRAAIESLTPQNPVSEGENRLLLGGEVRWHHWEHQALFDSAGNLVEYQSTGRDITNLKALEQELRESETRYRSVVEDQTELITRYLPDGRYSFVNQAFCRFFGKSMDEVVGGAWQPDAVPEDIPLIQAQLALISPETPSVIVENRVVSGSGEVRWMQFVNRGIFDVQGRLIETQTVGRDITAGKEAEAALKEYAQRLIIIEDNQRKRIAMELHDEVGQELTALSLNLAYMANKLGGSETGLLKPLDDSRSLVRAIHRSVRNLMVALHPTQLEEYGLVSALRTFAQQFHARSGITVAVQAPPDFPRLDAGDEIALFRIAQEALTNVQKHAEAAQVSITLAQDAATVRLSLSDDGKGIPAQHSQPRQPTSGWGLTIMRERAELIGGTFRMATAPGCGTTITIELPGGR